jgi:hypothetical protein
MPDALTIYPHGTPIQGLIGDLLCHIGVPFEIGS